MTPAHTQMLPPSLKMIRGIPPKRNVNPTDFDEPANPGWYVLADHGWQSLHDVPSMPLGPVDQMQPIKHNWNG